MYARVDVGFRCSPGTGSRGSCWRRFERALDSRCPAAFTWRLLWSLALHLRRQGRSPVSSEGTRSSSSSKPAPTFCLRHNTHAMTLLDFCPANAAALANALGPDMA
jgi:hypothetical protein